MLKKNQFLFVMFILFTLYSCQDNRLEEMEERIAKDLTSGRDSLKTFRLDTISSFRWDQVLVAGPYADLQKIEENLGYDLDGFPDAIKHHDSFILFGFMSKKKGVHYLEIKRKYLKDSVFLGNAGNYRFYSKSESIFPLNSNLY